MPLSTTLTLVQMGKEVPRANDEVLGIPEAERTTYWCNFAMVRADYQSKGVAKAMFERAFKEVSIQVSRSSKRLTGY